MDTTFKDAIAPTPDHNGGHDGTRGGFDIGGGKETPGQVIGTLPTLTNVAGAPGAGAQGSDFDLIAHHKAGMEFKG